MLKLGSHGDAVKSLQHTLRRYDPSLVPDGRFGPATERAVRLLQRRLAVFPPDGIAGPRTLAALAAADKARPNAMKEASWYDWAASLISRAGQAARTVESNVESFLSSLMPRADDIPKTLRPRVAPTRQRAVTAVMPAGTVTPVASMVTSREGRRFIVAHESVRGISDRLHWPGGVSGVTLGPGYDMGARTADTVVRDLTAIGVDRATAVAVSAGAGKIGHDARDFVRANKALVTIDVHQETALLDQIAPQYEARVKRSVRIPLHQYEFDALVSYAYNPGAGWRRTTALVNEHQPRAAMAEIARHVKSGHKVVDSLVVRRQAEANVFLYGVYR